MKGSQTAVPWNEEALERLTAAGFRRGGARQAVIDVLARENCALSVVEIEEALRREQRKAGRASIYRVLDELENLGLLARVQVGAGIARYEAQQPGGADHHHHLICDQCGQLIPFTDAGLERTIDRLSERLPFVVDEHEVTLRGACAGCSSRSR